MLSVSPASLTVPAGGTATATVTLDLDTGDLGLYSGRLTATARDGRTALTAAVGFHKDLLHTLTVTAIGRDRQARPSTPAASLFNLDTGRDPVRLHRRRAGEASGQAGPVLPASAGSTRRTPSRVPAIPT